MKIVLIISTFVLSAFAAQAQQLTNFADSVGYAIGLQVFNSLKQQNIDFSKVQFLNAWNDAANGKMTMTEADVRSVLEKMQGELQKKMQADMAKREIESKAKGAENRTKGAAFLAENGKRKGVTTTASGLQYEVLKAGKGAKPKASSKVKVHYTGTLLDGTKFDSSVDRGEPIEFELTGVIKGWTEGVQLMNTGAKYKFFIPADLAYGDNAAGSIPPGSTLVFEVELLSFQNAGK